MKPSGFSRPIPNASGRPDSIFVRAEFRPSPYPEMVPARCAREGAGPGPEGLRGCPSESGPLLRRERAV